MKKILSIASLLMFAAGLSACNTMSGLGQDVEAGGEKLQGTAERHQQR